MPRPARRTRQAAEARRPVSWPPWVAMAALLCALAALQFYLIAFKLPSHTFYSGDCGNKLLQVQSLAMTRWRSLSVVYPGEAIDPGHRFVETGFLLVRNGRVWGVHSATFALLSSVPYAWLGYRGLYVVPALSLLGAILLLWLLARSMYGPWRALLAMALAALCTPLFFYGVEFWEHTLALLLVMGAVVLLASASEVPARAFRLAAAGVLSAAAYTVRPEAAVFVIAAVLGLAAAVRPGRVLARSLGLFALGCLLVLVPLALLNQRLFGDPLGVLLALHVRSGRPDAKLLILQKLLMPLSAGTLWKSAAALVAAILLWRLRLREIARQRGWASPSLALFALAATFTIAIAEWRRLSALWREPSEVTSLLETFPVIWALPIVLVASHSSSQGADKARRRFLGATAAAYLLGTLAVSPTWGGAQWGPRLLLLALPLLALFAANFGNIRLASGRVALLSLLMLALPSLGVQATSVKWLARVKGLYVSSVGQFARLTRPGDVIVSDQQFLQQVLGSLYYQRRFFYLSSPTLTGDFVQSLRRAGVDHFYYFFARGQPERSVDQDLPQRLASRDLINQGLTIQRLWVITDMPYYFIRFGTRQEAGRPPAPSPPPPRR